MTAFVWASIAALAVALGLFIYWQLVIAEGVYLGQSIVTLLYDITARRYDHIKQFDSEIEAIFVGRPLANALRSQPQPLVLDVATGTGRVPRTLFEQPSFRGNVIGLDASWGMLEIAFRELAKYAGLHQLVCRNAMRLPFRDGWFDMVTCFEMLEFTPSPKRQLAEVFRVLKPGGYLVTTRRRGLDARLMPGKTFSKEQFGELLSAFGLTNIRIEPWQVDYDLVWSQRPGDMLRGDSSIFGAFVCDQCNKSEFQPDSNNLVCANCQRTLAVSNGIIDYREKRKA